MFSSKRTTIEEYTKRVSKTTSFLKKYGLAILFMAPYLISFLVFSCTPLSRGALCRYIDIILRMSMIFHGEDF